MEDAEEVPSDADELERAATAAAEEDAEGSVAGSLADLSLLSDDASYIELDGRKRKKSRHSHIQTPHSPSSSVSASATKTKKLRDSRRVTMKRTSDIDVDITGEEDADPNEENGDEKKPDDDDSYAVSAVKVVARVFKIDNATFSEEDEQHLKFSVGYYPVESEEARSYLYRDSEEVYLHAITQSYKLPLFPPQLKENGHYKEEYIQCARFVMSTRVRRLLLEDELRSMTDKNRQFIDLLALCVHKKAAFRERLLMLEHEMEHIAVEKQGTFLVSPGSRFNALLTVRPGWTIVFEFLTRECKRLQLPEDSRGVEVGEVDENLTLTTVLHIWDLLQLWQLFHSVHYRSKSGLNYPIPAKRLEETSLADEESGDSSQGRIQPPTIESIIKGQLAAQLAGSDDVLDDASVAHSLDNSSIATRSTLASNPIPAPGPPASDKSSEKSKSKSKGSKGNKEKENEGKKSGGWGFGGFNLFGGSNAKEEVEVVAAPSVIKLEPLVQGFGIGEWSEVCEALGCSRGSISLLAAANSLVHKIEESVVTEGHALRGIIPLVLKTDVQVSLEGMSDEDEVNPMLYIATKHIIDAIADRIESLTIDALRLYPNWQKTLESFRKERIRKSGGKLDHGQDGEVEVDKQGTIRVVPHADQIIDTDVLHGSRQRIQISVAMPELEKMIGSSQEKEDKVKGELACVLQFGYSLAAPLIQRAIRGTLARMRKRVAMRDLTLYVMHAAAVTLQGYIRARQGRKNFATAKAAVIGDLRTDMAIVLQRNLRMLPKWLKHKRYLEKKRYDSWWFAVTSFQAIIRGFNARHRVRRMKAMHKGDREGEEKVWNVELIQRVARGYIARKTIVRSLKVRKSISKKVLMFAEKYLQGGDLWGFLKEIDDEFSRVGKEMTATAHREDEMAHTFIEQVLGKRQGEFDGAWDRFSRSVTAQSKRRGAETTSEINDLTATSSGAVTKTSWGPAGASKSTDETNVPGPLLRRAVSATVQDGVQREVKRQKEGQSRGVKLAQQMAVAYSDGADTEVVGEGKSAAGKTTSKGKNKSNLKLSSSSMSALPGASSQTLGAGSVTSAATAPVASNKSKKEMENLLRSKKRKSKGQGQNNMKAAMGDFMTQAVASTTSGFAEPKEQVAVTGWSMEKACQGESLLIDIPKGVNDTMERLLRAAAIRCFVPEFFSGHAVASAYKMYLVLPPGLAKMRYEQEAFLYCQPAVSALRVKGVSKIADAMPPKRVKQFLVSVNTPTKLMNLAMDFLYTLIKMGDTPVGIVHSPTMQRQADFAEGKGTLQQILKASTSATSPSSKLSSPVQNNSPNSEPASKTSTTKSKKGVNSSMLSMQESGSEGPRPVEEETETDIDPTVPNRLLVDMVERGQWASMLGAADDLLMHAAFLVVPFVQKTKMSDGSTQEIPTEYGHAAFKAHTRALLMAASDEEKRELVRERFRAALMLTTPFTLRLKADGTLKVMDLLERKDLHSMGMPPVLLDQVEALLSTAVSLSVSSKVVPTVRDHLSTGQEIFTVPMIFDPKFQRGPFDPYGRAPRIMPKLKIKKTKPDKPVAMSVTANSGQKDESKGGKNADNVEEEEDDGDDENFLPAGLWEKKTKKVKSNLSMQQAKKLWGFQSNLPMMKKKGDEGSVIAEGSASIEDGTIGDTIVSIAPGPQTDAFQTVSSQEASSRPASKKDMHERARLLKRDFETKVRSGFERPYACSFPGCEQAFSRAYSLKIHEKSHALFGNYHKFRNEAQIFLDPDKKTAAAEARAAFEARIVLPPLVQEEIYLLRVAAAQKAFELTFEGPKQTVIEEKQPSRPPTVGQIHPELAWPSPEAPAQRELQILYPPSRGIQFSPPSSPWKLPSRGSLFSRGSSYSRGASRGGSRGSSRGGNELSVSMSGDSITPWGSESPINAPRTPGSRGSVTFALHSHDVEEDEEEEFRLQAPPLRFGMSLDSGRPSVVASTSGPLVDPFSDP